MQENKICEYVFKIYNKNVIDNKIKIKVNNKLVFIRKYEVPPQNQLTWSSPSILLKV